MEELWKSHEEYPHVEFSNLGNARKLLPNGEYKTYNQTCCKAQPYLQTNIKSGVKVYTHREVCKLFNPNPNPAEYTHVLHNNHDCHDNRAENLRWGTQQQNMQDRLEAGHYRRGFGHNMAKLTNLDIFTIRWLWAHQAATQAEIASYFGIKPCTISFITTGKTWKHLLREGRIKE
jgi:hypothetical protein